MNRAGGRDAACLRRRRSGPARAGSARGGGIAAAGQDLHADAGRGGELARVAGEPGGGDPGGGLAGLRLRAAACAACFPVPFSTMDLILATLITSSSRAAAQACSTGSLP